MKNVLRLKLPEDLRAKIEKHASLSNLSINQFITCILTKTIANKESQYFLNKKLKNIDISKLKEIISKIPLSNPLYFEDKI